MAGTPPLTVPIEYARGVGAFFPSSTTTASQAGVQQAVQSINGISSSALEIAAGPSSGATVNVTQSGETISIGVSVVSTGAVAGVGTAYPTSPSQGTLFYRTDLGHLYIFLTVGGWTVV